MPNKPGVEDAEAILGVSLALPKRLNFGAPVFVSVVGGN